MNNHLILNFIVKMLESNNILTIQIKKNQLLMDQASLDFLTTEKTIFIVWKLLISNLHLQVVTFYSLHSYKFDLCLYVTWQYALLCYRATGAIAPHCGFFGVSPDGNCAYVHWGFLRPTLVQSDEPSDLRSSLSPTTRHRILVYPSIYF